MIRLVACVSYYNEAENIVGMLESIKDVVDGVHLVDGRYLGYPATTPLSTDWTASLASKWCAEHKMPFQFSEKADYRQKVKRTVYLQETAGSDADTWFLVIDPDERFTDQGGFREAFEKRAAEVNRRTKRPMHRALAIMMQDEQLEKSDFPKNRLIRWAPGLHYQPNHWTIADANDKLYMHTNIQTGPILPGRIVNSPYRGRSWERRWMRALFRAIRLINHDSNYGMNRFESGSEKPARFLDSEEELRRVKALVEEKIDREVRDFDIGFHHILDYLMSEAKGAPPVMGEVNRGEIIGMLYALRLIPNPYA